MGALRAVTRRLWNTVSGGDDRAMEAEFESHIAMQTEDNIRMGLAPEEAERAARLKFGTVEAVKEVYRDQRGAPVIETLLRDLNYAGRAMRRSPGFTLVAMLSLAIGIGANTAIFSVVNGVLLKPLPFPNEDRLFAMRERLLEVNTESMPANPAHVLAWAKQCPSVESVSASRLAEFTLLSGGEAEQIAGAEVDPGMFRTLGILPALGRQFSADEAREGKDRVVIVSDSLWRRRFKSNPGLAGSTIVLGGLQHQVVGVLPPQFAFPHGGGMEAVSKLSRSPEIFRPLVYRDEELTSAALGNFNYGAILRVKAGVPRQRVLAEINAVEAQYPAMVGEKLTLKADMIPMSDLMVGNVRRGLWMLLGAVGAVLLIVCVNLANLLIARATARTREMAIRSALGAGRSRLLGQMLTESVALSVIGGALGLVMAYAGVQALVAAAPADLPRLYEVRVDGTVLAFAVGLAILTGLVSGVLPGLGLSRSDPQDALKSGSHTVTSGIASLKTRQLLIGAEVALSAALLIVAGLLTVSFVRLKGVDKGFDTERVLAVDISLSNAKYTEGKDRAAYFKRALERLAALPGVSAAGVISSLPARGETWIDPVCLVGDTRPVFERPLPNNRMTSPDYFRTMGVPVLLGRAFTDSDQSQKVAIFSKKLADVLWPGQNPVGRQFLGYNDTPHTLVGVVGDVRSTLSDEPAMIVYYPHWERPRRSMSLVLRTTGDPAGLSGGVRTAIRELDADVPVREMKPMDQVVGDSLSQRTFQLTIVLLFAASALIVAGLGIYGIVSYSVSRRRTELGLRSALGARTSNLLWMVVRQAMTPVILGLAGGTAIALSLGGVIESLLFGVKPADVPTIAAVVLVLGSVALAACLGPAYGAVRKNPARTLRFE